jgi:hypothetical protein
VSEGSFSAQIDAFCVRTTLEIEAYCRGVALTLFGLIIEATPVLSGRLRGDWRTSVGSPILESRPEINASPEELLRIAMDEMRAVVGAWDTKEPVFLTNNMPYAEVIEYEGHSRIKAPQGMVRVSIAVVAANLKQGGV